MNICEKPLAVFGLGYVGLPLSLNYSLRGYKVYGIDISEKLVKELKSGITHHFEKYRDRSINDILRESLHTGNFIPTNDPSEALKLCDKFIVTVGIPADGENLNFEPLQAVCATVSLGLKKGDTVIIRSTVVPGTTEEKLVPILEHSGLNAGSDFYLAYCPERISEGNAFDEFTNIPVVISGINGESVAAGKEIIQMISSIAPIPVSSIKAAETAKVLENIQRDVNIAMVHQFAGFCNGLGIDIFELVKAVNTHPRVHLLKPGPGVGGYCIPNALHYLKPKADELGIDLELLVYSRSLNDSIPLKIAGEAQMHLLASGKEPAKSKVAVLGIAMKDYCSDDRQSPVIEIIGYLKNLGISVQAYDPCVCTMYDFKTADIRTCVDKADLLLITALQKGIDYNDLEFYKLLMNEHPIIFDTRNVIDKIKAEAYGFRVTGM